MEETLYTSVLKYESMWTHYLIYSDGESEDAVHVLLAYFSEGLAWTDGACDISVLPTDLMP